MRSFDRKFGEEYVAALPAVPGVYRVYGPDDTLIYVGKAKNLRRRISQYRNAKRRKKHAKMRSIVAEAHRLEFDTCPSELEACLLEARLIQEHRPRWNVAGAFHFLYPMIGIHESRGFVYFCYSTSPQKFPEFTFHGAYRSRHVTGEAFFALVELLKYVGHALPRTQVVRNGFGKRDRYSHVFGFRRVDREWLASLQNYFRGESREAIEDLLLALTENAAARGRKKLIQDRLNALARFWRHEATKLKQARASSGFDAYPVPQNERDFLFLKHRYGRA